MAYAFPGEGALDYFPCRYGTSRLLFRGPRRSLERPFIAFLGGTETYGKYVPDPFPDLVEEEVGFAAVNLGCMNAGIDVYLNEEPILQIAERAEAVVMQVVGAGNLTNKYYTVHPRRNDRFIGASPLLRALYKDVDFTEFNFTRHMLLALHSVSHERFEIVAQELRGTWIVRMKQLLARLPKRTLLLWMASHSPTAETRDLGLSLDPILVDKDMLDEVRPGAAAYVEAVSSLQARLSGFDGMAFAAMEAPAAAALPGPEVHRDVARMVASAIEPVLA